jgi:hypothetical protein
VLVATVQALVRARAAEAAMRASERKFRTIYEQAPGGIAMIGRDGCLRDANPGMLGFLGRTLEDVAGRPLVSFVAPDDREAVQKWLASTQPGDLQFALNTAEGRTTDLLWRLSRDADTDLGLLVAVDVSRRRQVELQRQELLDSERMARGVAERISRMKDELIAVLSHELRSPLNAIMGWTHVLLKRGGDAITMQGLTAVERNVRTQARLITDILDMSRLTMGKMHLTIEAVDPVVVMQDAIAAMRGTADEAGLTLLLEAQPAHRTIRADSGRVQQIVWNLISNAIKFSARGGEVRVRLADEDEGVRIAVIDQGQGIAPEFLPRLFDRFTQDDIGSNRLQGGMGLGLSIVKQLAEAHGGHVSAYSRGPGHGARFEVFLPAAPAVQPLPADAPAAAEAEEPTVAGDLGESALHGMRVLVVDDDPDASAMLQIILGDRGAHVTTAGGADEALALLHASAYDVMVSDIGMPSRDGYELIREVRRTEAVTGRRLPAIALTSFARPQDVQRALQAGFDLHCAKPLRPLKLVQAVLSLLRA